MCKFQIFQGLLDFFGVKDIQTWSKLSLDEKRKYHESFAYNYEIYLFEGKAPNNKLEEISSKLLFDRILPNLIKLYAETEFPDGIAPS